MLPEKLTFVADLLKLRHVVEVYQLLLAVSLDYVVALNE